MDLTIQGDQLYMADGRVLLVPCKTGLVRCALIYSSLQNTKLFTRYQNNTAKFIWSGCHKFIKIKFDKI